MNQEYNKFYDLMTSGKYGQIIEEKKVSEGLKDIYFAFNKPSSNKEELNGKLEEMLKNINFVETFAGDLTKYEIITGTQMGFAQLKFRDSFKYKIPARITVSGDSGSHTSNQNLEVAGVANVVMLTSQSYLDDFKSEKIKYGTEKSVDIDYLKTIR